MKRPGPVPPRVRGERAVDTARAWLAVARLAGLARAVRSRVDGERRLLEEATRLLGLEVRVHGRHHLRPGDRYLVAPLHDGIADVLALGALPLDMAYVARDEIASWPLVGAPARRGRHLFVDPERPVAAYRSVLRAAPAVVDAGTSLVVFPQGSLLGVEIGFRPGAFRLARVLGLPVLPVAIAGSHRVWEHPFGPVVRFDQTVHVQILPPVPASGAVASAAAIERRVKRAALALPAPVRRFDPERDGWWDGYSFDIDPSFPELAARLAARRSAA